MALSKNFTLPEKCKNHWRALRESNIDQTVFIQNCLEVVLFFRGNWRGLLLGRRARGLFRRRQKQDGRASSCRELSSLL